MMKPYFSRLWWSALGLNLALLVPVSAQNAPAPAKVETLAESVRKGDLAAVKAATEAKAKQAMSSSRGQASLYTAIKNGEADTVGYLLEMGADPNAEMYGTSPLGMAMGFTENWKPVAETLLARGAKINGGDNDGETPLSRAISFGGGSALKDRISWLLFKGADLNARNHQGRSALETALSGSNTELVTLRLEKADVKTTDDNGNTPLFAAVMRGSAEYVRMLLTKGADLNAQNANGDTVLHFAAQNPGALLKVLLDAGARTDVKNHRGDLPLHLALRRRSDGAMMNGIYYGVDYEFRAPSRKESTVPHETLIAPLTGKSDINVRDQFGLSPLLLAILARDQESRDIIIERKPKTDSTTQMFDAVARGDVAQLNAILKQKPFLVYFRLADGTTPLHVAALWGTLGAAQLLIQKGADINARDARGETPLHETLTRPTGLFARRAKNMLAFLLERGADVNALDQNDASALHRAAKIGDAELLTALLAKNVNPNVRDKSGQTPIFALMTKNSDLKLVQALLDKGASVNVRPQLGGSLLSRAVMTRRRELVQLVLDKGADVNAKDRHGLTALAALLRNHHSGGGSEAAPVAALLLAEGADPNAKVDNESLIYHAVGIRATDIIKILLDTKKVNLKASSDRESPLWQAVNQGRTDIVGMLLDAGADPNEKDSQGRPILKTATARSREMGDLLRARGAKDE